MNSQWLCKVTHAQGWGLLNPVWREIWAAAKPVAPSFLLFL